MLRNSISCARWSWFVYRPTTLLKTIRLKMENRMKYNIFMETTSYARLGGFFDVVELNWNCVRHIIVAYDCYMQFIQAFSYTKWNSEPRKQDRINKERHARYLCDLTVWYKGCIEIYKCPSTCRYHSTVQR